MDASKLIGYDGIFATRLRALMKSTKATQQDVAAAVGTTRQAISQYADGAVQPNIEKLYKIAEYFNVSGDYLLGISDVTTSDIDDKAMSEALGLSDDAITALKKEANVMRIVKTTQGYSPVKGVYPTKASVINKLLEEQKKSGGTVIDILRQLFSYKKDGEQRSKKRYDCDPAIALLFESNEPTTRYSFIPTDEEAFAVILLRLQQHITQYKAELDEQSGNRQ